jgi:hypothetical protein
MNRYLLVASALMLLILNACSKADNTPTAQEDLRTGTWFRPVIDSQIVFGKVTYKDPVTNGDSTRNYMPHNLLCHLDNSLQFKANGNGVLSYGVAKCSGSEADTRTFTWEMSDDGNRLSMYGVGDFFGTDNVEATVTLRSMGYLTLRYREVTINPRFQTSDTLIFTDTIRRF